LEEVGFVNVRAEDRTELFVRMLKKQLKRLADMRNKFVQVSLFFASKCVCQTKPADAATMSRASYIQVGTRNEWMIESINQSRASNKLHSVSNKLCHFYFLNSSVKQIFNMQSHETTWRKWLYSFDHLTSLMSLHYLVKCRSRTLAIYNKEFILASACIGSENHWDHKIIENV